MNEDVTPSVSNWHHPVEHRLSTIVWSKINNHTNWATLSAGWYLLRTNVQDWSDEELWKAYVQISEAEAALRIHNTDLQLRPIWH